MCTFHFIINILNSIIPPFIGYIAYADFIDRKRKNNSIINRYIYKEKFKYTFEQFFNDTESISTDKFNISIIPELLNDIILFQNEENKFYGWYTRRKFDKIFNLAIIIENKKSSKGFKGIINEIEKEEYYEYVKKELKPFKKEFMIFHQIIFGYI